VDIDEVRERIMRKLAVVRSRAVKAGEIVELPNGCAVELAEAQAMGYEITRTGDAEAPYAIEYKGPPFVDPEGPLPPSEDDLRQGHRHGGAVDDRDRTQSDPSPSGDGDGAGFRETEGGPSISML